MNSFFNYTFILQNTIAYQHSYFSIQSVTEQIMKHKKKQFIVIVKEGL